MRRRVRVRHWRVGFTQAGCILLGAGVMAAVVGLGLVPVWFPGLGTKAASSSVGIHVSSGTLVATNLIPGVATNKIPLRFANTGTVFEDFNFQFSNVIDNLSHFADLGQLEVLVTSGAGVTIYSLNPGGASRLGLTKPLTLSGLQGDTIPIATGVAPGHGVSTTIAVELASGEGFGNAWNGRSATIDYKLVATQSAAIPSTSPSQTSPVPNATTSPTSATVNPATASSAAVKTAPATASTGSKPPTSIPTGGTIPTRTEPFVFLGAGLVLVGAGLERFRRYRTSSQDLVDSTE
ncbi:MAG: hypothetical protein ACYDHP_06200 [Ferrimicrobium sp.]